MQLLPLNGGLNWYILVDGKEASDALASPICQ
jgi:hypothetical protein